MFSPEFAYTLEAAYKEATQRGHDYFCLEHLLYAMISDPEVATAIKACGGNPEQLKEDLEKFFSTLLESESEKGQKSEPIQTPAVQRVLQRAIMHMHSAGKDVVTGKEVLVQVFEEKDAHAVYFLSKQSISKFDLLDYISHGVSKYAPVVTETKKSSKENLSNESLLETFALDLTEEARQGKLDPVIGREKELERILKVLCRRHKNNPLLLGDPGTGKTAMANALAQKLITNEVPESLQEASLYSINMGNLLAGTKFRGEFEQRLKQLVDELSKEKNSIIFIDEIHTIVGAGATGTGSMDAANILKPALAFGHIKCVGSSTHEEYKKNFEKDRALNRRFSVINIEEPSREVTLSILNGLKGKFEDHHNIRYSKQALKAAVDLSIRHINDRFLPDKAIDVLDEAGAANNLLPKNKRKKTIGEKEIEKVVSSIARVPVKSVSKNDIEALKDLEKNLKEKVFGQDLAVSAVAKAIKRNRAGLKTLEKPVGCFLFAGPTGVGKTELAKSLASVLSVPFHRFDMSEYMEKHAVARLIGAPPGYVGYEEGGLLIDLVRKHPYAVLLLDEIEKAHQDVFNILLQVMDDAHLTDTHGRQADFRNIIIIMTTNAGSEQSASMGFGKKGLQTDNSAAIKKIFKPEFRNRLDEIVQFNALPHEVVLKVVEKFISELSEQLKESKVDLIVTKEAKEYLAKKGFDSLMGARPMQRVIQKEIKDPLSDKILFAELKKGGKVKIELIDNMLSVLYE